MDAAHDGTARPEDRVLRDQLSLDEFNGELPPILAETRTVHWFDPCSLLSVNARSEYLPEFRERQAGGGWQPKTCGARKDVA